MNIGDYLLKSNKITQKQREKAELEHVVTGHKFGKCCIDLGFINRTDLNQALKVIQRVEKGDKPMATEIGEGSKFTFDLKFMATIGVIIVSACATYFRITGQVDDNKKEIDNIKSMGELKIISYKLDEYDEMFKEIKDLMKTLSPLAADLEYIKSELSKLKNKKIDIPDFDLSGVEKKLDNLTDKIESFETRLKKVDKKAGGRF